MLKRSPRHSAKHSYWKIEDLASSQARRHKAQPELDLFLNENAFNLYKFELHNVERHWLNEQIANQKAEPLAWTWFRPLAQTLVWCMRPDPSTGRQLVTIRSAIECGLIRQQGETSAPKRCQRWYQKEAWSVATHGTTRIFVILSRIWRCQCWKTPPRQEISQFWTSRLFRKPGNWSPGAGGSSSPWMFPLDFFGWRTKTTPLSMHSTWRSWRQSMQSGWHQWWESNKSLNQVSWKEASIPLREVRMILKNQSPQQKN